MTKAVQAWADGFGNWHALVTEEFPLEAHKLAKQAIADELRARDAGFDGEGFDVVRIYAKGNQTEFVEYWEHDPQTIRSAVAECGECGRLFPDIYPSARCPFEYEHAQQPEMTGIHHKACEGEQCETLGCKTLSDVIRNLHHSGCTFWACPGPTEYLPMATCNVHGAYHQLLSIAKGTEEYCDCAEPQFTRPNPGEGDWFCANCDRYEMPQEG